jgi:hypothetical protein
MKFIFISATADMVLPPPTKEVMERVRAEFGLDEEGIKQATQVLKDWLQQQPHLPHDCGKWRETPRTSSSHTIILPVPITSGHIKTNFFSSFLTWGKTDSSLYRFVRLAKWLLF